MAGRGGSLTDLAGWLEPRLVGAPDSLRERILSAVGSQGVGGGPLTPHPSGVTAHLRRIAESLLDAARHGLPARETALTLLAADALITLAVEAELTG